MLFILDISSIFFWSIAYILVIIYSFREFPKEHKKAIPINAVMFNLSWEINAFIISGGWLGHVFWLFLDIAIFIITVRLLDCKKKQLLYLLMTAFVFLVFNFVFLTYEGGMLLLSFAIDFIMAALFWLRRHEILARGRVAIAVMKLFGDLAAAVFYSPMSRVVFALATLVLILNVAYLIYAIKESLERKWNRAIQANNA